MSTSNCEWQVAEMVLRVVPEGRPLSLAWLLVPAFGPLCPLLNVADFLGSD